LRSQLIELGKLFAALFSKEWRFECRKTGRNRAKNDFIQSCLAQRTILPSLTPRNIVGVDGVSLLVFQGSPLERNTSPIPESLLPLSPMPVVNRRKDSDFSSEEIVPCAFLTCSCRAQPHTSFACILRSGRQTDSTLTM